MKKDKNRIKKRNGKYNNFTAGVNCCSLVLHLSKQNKCLVVCDCFPISESNVLWLVMDHPSAFLSMGKNNDSDYGSAGLRAGWLLRVWVRNSLISGVKIIIALGAGFHMRFGAFVKNTPAMNEPFPSLPKGEALPSALPTQVVISAWIKSPSSSSVSAVPWQRQPEEPRLGVSAGALCSQCTSLKKPTWNLHKHWLAHKSITCTKSINQQLQ